MPSTIVPLARRLVTNVVATAALLCTRVRTRRYRPSQVAQFYDRITPVGLPHTGDIFQANRPSDDDEFIEYLVRSAGLKAGQTILDAGCGVCGPAIRFVQRLPITVEALTISAVQAVIARKKVTELGLDNRISVTQGDYHFLDALYSEEHFDTVLFLEAFGHASDPKKLVRSTHRVLRTGGHVYIKEYFLRETDDLGLAARRQAVQRKANAAWTYNCPTLNKTLTLLRRAGFHIVFVRRPGFENDRSILTAIEEELGIDLFEGKEEVVPVEHLEILCQKLPW